MKITSVFSNERELECNPSRGLFFLMPYRPTAGVRTHARAVFVLRDDVDLSYEHVEVTIVQPEGPACGQKFDSHITIVSVSCCAVLHRQECCVIFPLLLCVVWGGGDCYDFVPPPCVSCDTEGSEAPICYTWSGPGLHYARVVCYYTIAW